MIGKIVFGMVIVAAMMLLVSLGHASPGAVMENVHIESGKVYYDGISYEGAIVLENIGNENVTVSVKANIDGIEILNTELNLSIEHFHGFRIKTCKSIFFEVPCEEGIHELRTFISVGGYTRITSRPYKTYGCLNVENEEEEEVEEINVEDWLGCP